MDQVLRRREATGTTPASPGRCTDDLQDASPGRCMRRDLGARGSTRPATSSLQEIRALRLPAQERVALYGGFEPSVGDVGWRTALVSNITILSGDIGTVGDAGDKQLPRFYHPAELALDLTPYSTVSRSRRQRGWRRGAQLPRRRDVQRRPSPRSSAALLGQLAVWAGAIPPASSPR